ncbi:amidase [Caballeronia sp. INDeC2]|uniref:amidase n=1 Tax=Caballeronia sp. INDeC2 TaxID=2921747 RepID=UPI002028EB73|nr:amidase [Caballeronia sp. INDeC2]
MDILNHSATELALLYRRKRLSPVEVCRASIVAIHSCNPVINAFQHVDEAASLDQARDSEARWMTGAPLGPLDGVPCTIKDNLLTAGWPTRSGSRTVDPSGPWTEDAPAVARLRESGAVLLGKTTMPEFAWKVTTDAPLFGVTRNPWNPAVTPGGSSGGAAAATACGMGVLALATDGGGSIRVPASRCGLVGLKPTHGRVSDYPPSRFGTHSNVGPITRTVADCAAMMNAIAWPDSRDWYALPYDGDDFGAGLSLGASGLRIGVSLDFGSGCAVDREIAAYVHQAAGVFADLGAHVEALAFPPELYREGARAYEVARSAMLATLLRQIPAERHALMDPELVRAAQSSSDDIDVARYVDAEHSRRLCGMRINRLFERYDLLLCPTIHTLAEPVGEPAPQPWLTMLFNGSRHPALSMPCGMSAAGVPIGVQLIGPHYAEATLLRAAAAFEAARPFEALPIGRPLARIEDE